jgi:hypothetical protein
MLLAELTPKWSHARGGTRPDGLFGGACKAPVSDELRAVRSPTA